MTSDRAPRVAMLSVHTSPLEQPGTGDAGGMNVYVLELSRALAARGARVEIFTRATSSDLPETVVLDGADADGRPLRGEDARDQESYCHGEDGYRAHEPSLCRDSTGHGGRLSR